MFDIVFSLATAAFLAVMVGCEQMSRNNSFDSLSSNWAQSADLEVPRVDVIQERCGALLRDDFNRGQINTSLWRIWQQDPGINVDIDNGELRIHGHSAKFVGKKVATNLSRYVGLISTLFTERDVSLAARVKMPSGISSEPGAHTVNVHLCGVDPDRYPEVLFGKLEGPEMEKICRIYLDRDRAYQDARGWWFGVVDGEQGRYWWRVSGAPMPEQGDEQARFYDVLVSYDAPSGLARGYIKLQDKWIQLGEAESVSHAFTKVELKLTNVTYAQHYGTYREARFDDCRLYLNPENNPVRFVVKSGGQMYQGPRLRIGLYAMDGEFKVSEGYTDENGETVLYVDGGPWIAFPTSALFRIFQGEQEIGKSKIESHGVEGLYPADTWILDSNQLNLRPQATGEKQT